MPMFRCGSSSFALVLDTKPLVGALAAALLMCSSANAANFGHSRIVSALGQPLHINVSVTQLSSDEQRTLAVAPAPLSAWQQAGLIPPVDLAALELDILDGYTPGTRVISLRSTETFDRPVVDLLLDVSTSSGRQRYQVSLLAQAPYGAASTQRSSDLRGGSSDSAAQRAPVRSIRVRPGDTMFAIARRNAVQGVTIYQMMIALQRANPRAFIHGNVNLVKAGATLRVPDKAALTAISDREARRIFQQHAQAFALYRQKAAASVATVGQEGGAASGVVSAGTQPPAEEPLPGPQDQLRLSGSSAASGANGNASVAGGSGSSVAAAGTATDRADIKADDSVAARKGMQESEGRVSQLEENVKNLNEALRSQGGAASDLLVEGAKGLGQSLSDAASAVTGKPSASGSSGTSPGGADGAQPAGSSGSESSGAAVGQTGPDGSNKSVASAGASGGNATQANAQSGVAASTGAEGSGTQASSASGGTTAATSGATGTTETTGTSGAAGTAGSTGSAGSAGGDTSAAPSTSGAPAGGTSSGAAGNGGAAAAPGAGNGQGASPAGPGTASSMSGASPSASGPAPASGSGTSATPSPGALAADASGAKGSTSAGEASSTNKSGASDGNQGAGQGTPETSSKAEQIVSWLQEHMLGVITGVLALIVLIIAWLLRRANTARDDGRDDSAGLITEAMVKEKLDQINLDLEHQVPDEARSRKG